MRPMMATNPRVLRLTKDPLIRLVMASDGVKPRDVVIAFSDAANAAVEQTTEQNPRRTTRPATRKWVEEYFRTLDVWN